MDQMKEIEKVMRETARVFGCEVKASAWLNKPLDSLGGAKPIDLMVNKEGREKVREMLNAIDFGFSA